MKKLENLEQFKSWAKDTGFIYPSSEIYGGFQAVYDYGHYGILLKNNIQRLWEKSMIQERDDVVLLDSGIFMHPKTWVASGHVGGFDDVLVEDKKTHKRYRADHLVEEMLSKLSDEEIEKGLPLVTDQVKEFIKVTNDSAGDSGSLSMWQGRLTNAIKNRDADKLDSDELNIIIKAYSIKSPDGNDLTEPRAFNLLVKSNMGTTDASFNDENVTYLRGETCQGIYLEYKNYVDTLRVKVPFGIAQVGKAFRNEIVARQFVFRTREFEQMEMQYFHHPEDKEAKFEMWKEERMKWHVEEMGINPENLRFKKHEKLIFYATAAFDIEYNFKTLGGFKELEGIHDRGDYDLTQHAKFSGQKLDYFDQENNRRYVPHIMETSVGLNRTLMMVLEEAWTEETLSEAEGDKPVDTRVVLKIKKSLAPIKVAILPLSRRSELQDKAKEIQKVLKKEYMTEYDETASIGKRYRRQDEIGTPYCVTVDFETANDNSVTVRDRDSMKQDRVRVGELANYLKDKFEK
jgi:glycyl-tRNA synthetase